MPTSPETHSGGERRQSPTQERHEARRGHEYRPNPEAEKNELDLARKSALKEASENSVYDRSSENKSGSQTAPPRASKVVLKTSFAKTMAQVRQQLPARQRLFSRIVHAPVIEKLSDVTSTTIARPTSLLSGSIGALIITSLLYMAARYYGFALSGSETIIAFVAGWILGTIFDVVRAVVGRKL